MKRVICIVLSIAFLCGIVVNNLAIADTTVRPTVSLVESSFENGLESPFYANENDSGAAATIEKISIEGDVNGYLHITDRTAETLSATAQQNIKSKIIANGAAGKYYISARIKLDNPEDTAYAVPYIHGNKVTLQPGGGNRFPVTGNWTEVGKESDGSFMAFSAVSSSNDLTDANLAALTWCKFYFRLYAASTGNTTYDGSYSIDDVVIWFVPNEGAPSSVTQIGTNILADGDFQANLTNPGVYDDTNAAGLEDVWYVGVDDYNNRLCKLTIATESSAVDAKYVHSGKSALHITNRPGTHQSIAVDMKSIVSEVGALAQGEGYYLSVWLRAEDGETIKVRPIFGSNKGNGFVVGGDYITVTDQWTEVGILNDNTYSMFKTESGGFFDPFNANWAHIRLATEGTQSFYVDDFKVMGPQKHSDAVSAFVQGVNSLPAPANITHSHKNTIAALEESYQKIDQSVLNDEQKTALAEAKAKLDAARAALDALPPEKKSFQPVFEYKNKANLIEPYGDFETFTENDYIWNEENVEGGKPVYTLITDKNIAHSGNNCLLISNREKTQHAAAITITDVIRNNGGGKYYVSAWMRTKNPGEEMDVMPFIYSSNPAKEYYVKGKNTFRITNEWTFVGVTYDDVDSYFDSGGDLMLDSFNGYIALRFYGMNESLESAEDGVLFPDYYIDDVKLWKYFEGQEDYVDPDAPKDETTTTDGGRTDNTSPTTGTPGNNPRTGYPVSFAMPVLGATCLGGIMMSRRRKIKK